MDSTKKLYRSEKDKVIAGVCAGLAEYLNIDVSLVRLVFLLGAILGFSSAFWIYLIMWLLVPTKANSDSAKDTVKENVQDIKETAQKAFEDIKEKF